MRIAQEEIFGPVVSVLPCRSLEEAVEIGNDVKYGLSASIYTQDVNRAFAAMRDLDTGIFYVNAPTIGAEVHLPFGGTKATGNGHREAGTAALDVFSEWKSIYVDFSGRCSARRSIPRRYRMSVTVDSRQPNGTAVDKLTTVNRQRRLSVNRPCASQSSPATASASRSRPKR